MILSVRREKQIEGMPLCHGFFRFFEYLHGAPADKPTAMAGEETTGNPLPPSLPESWGGSTAGLRRVWTLDGVSFWRCESIGAGHLYFFCTATHRRASNVRAHGTQVARETTW